MNRVLDPRKTIRTWTYGLYIIASGAQSILPPAAQGYDNSFVMTSEAMIRCFGALFFINKALTVIADIKEIVKSLYSMLSIPNVHKPVFRLGRHIETRNFELSIQRFEQSGRVNGHRSTLSGA